MAQKKRHVSATASASRRVVVALRMAGIAGQDKLNGIFDGKPIWGAQLAYYYNSIVGPLGGSLSWSNFSKRIYLYVNLGFEF